MKLNQELIKNQGLNGEEVKHLESLYEELEELFDDILYAQEVSERTGRPFVKDELIEDIQALEYRLQEAWKFDQDKNYHTYWRRNPLCDCPSMDNDELIGTQYRIYSGDCPLHGHFVEEEK